MNTPTEYFGPHAKRWTDPDTGVTYSLKPRDYYQLVAEEKAKIEAAAAVPREPSPLEHLIIEDATPEKVERALAEAGWPNVIRMETVDDRDLGPWFNEPPARTQPGNIVVPPEHQRYDLNAFSQMADDAEMAGRYHAIVYGATRGGIKYPTAESLVRGRIHSATLSDDGMGQVSSSPAAPAGVRSGERPAGRHWRHRRPQRIARWFAKFGRHPRLWVATGLVYIIAIIGVAVVAGVMS